MGLSAKEWSSPQNALAYLNVADNLPRRSEGESVLIDHLPENTKRVLDLGTRDGRLIRLIKENKPDLEEAVALDVSPTMLKSADYVLLFQDEKRPIAAKTYGGSSWSSVQAMVEHDQKVKGLLNVFGVYDYTNDKMYTRCYKQKKSNQFIDFIERVDSFYDLNIKRIFLVLDNASIHTNQRKLKKH
jgi:SAM-dependent methyltransferase